MIMRPRTVMMPFAVGLAGYAWLSHRRKRRTPRDGDTARAARFARDGSLASDPRDPVQSFDEVSELQGMPLEVDVQSQADAEAAQDLASLESELEEELGLDGEADGKRGAAAIPADGEVIELTHRKVPGPGDAGAPQVRPRDAGELYGAHTPRAADRTHPDDDRAFQDGQNWLEALEISATENGPEPERELESVDDADVLSPPHASDTRDTPVADRGAGGRRGL
jgi:hypothetical protein